MFGYRSISAVCAVLMIVLLSGPLQAGDYPPELRGRFELGDKIFDHGLDGGGQEPEDPDTYIHHRGYLRYQRRFAPNSHYYFRYEYMKRDYTLREQFTSTLHEFTGNLTYQPDDLWRIYITPTYRVRSYPEAVHRTYSAVIPTFQLNYYPTEITTCTARYSLQRRWYPEGTGDFDRQALALTVRHDLSSRLRLESRLRFNRDQPHDSGEGGDLERQVSLGFRYVLE